MPIDYKQYHPNFRKRSRLCLKKARYTCQYCWARRGEEYLAKSGRIAKKVIQAHHLNHDPMNGHATLIALCEQCHIKIDAPYRAKKGQMIKAHRHFKAQKEAGQMELWRSRTRDANLFQSGARHD